MKKELLLGVLAIGVVGLFMGAGTFAYFTSNQTVTGNTFTAGKLIVELRGPASSPITINDMEPGVWYGTGDEYTLTIYNNDGAGSTMDAKCRIRSHLDSQSVPGMWSKINVKVYKTYDSGVTWTEIYNGKLKDMVITGTEFDRLNPLPCGWSAMVKFEYQLDPAVGNDFMGASVVFDMLVDATQTSNPGWT